MPVEIIMPRVAPAMTDGMLVRWCKNEGDLIEKDEIVAEVTSEKATFEIQSLYDGIISKFLYNPGDVIPVNEPIAVVILKDENINGKAENIDYTMEPANKLIPEVKETVSTNDIKHKASPLAKKMAKHEGIDLSKVSGSGPGGRIIKQDVLDYIEIKLKHNSMSMQDVKVKEEITGVESEDRKIPFTGIRKLTAKQLQLSKDNIVPVTSVTEVDFSNLVELHEQIKKDWLDMYGIKVTLNAFIIRAVALSLKKHDILNSQLDGDNIVIKSAVNIGLAMNINNNLFVPVIRNTDKLSVLEIAQEITELVNKVKNNTITLEDMKGGTFTITNVGPYDVQFSTPVINYPQTGILGIGTINERPAFIGDEIVKRQFCYISLTYDHRIVDGAPAADFRKTVKSLLERPLLILK